ncbi:methyltransferase-like protein 22 isoform X2 [Convolutriloba macropyga]|uniref:methyltransferase-like protein 22 isoform X2 n=1 Tax=Convolutriloba macropyga TaxID=536237 RepID=UPI003F524E82
MSLSKNDSNCIIRLSKIGDTDEDSAMRNTRTGSSVAGPVANEVCYVRHKMETTLNDVGLQVWNGALLMCDYILQNQQMFKGTKVLELGAGTGIVSIILSSICDQVICSDKDEQIVSTSEENLNNNNHLRSPCCKVECTVIDWMKPENIEFEILKNLNVIVACDVAYDSDISDHFVSCLLKICSELFRNSSRKNLHLFLAIEKRMVFCSNDIEPSFPAFTYFEEILKSKFVPALMAMCVICDIQSLNVNSIKNHFEEFERPSSMELVSISLNSK